MGRLEHPLQFGAPLWRGGLVVFPRNIYQGGWEKVSLLPPINRVEMTPTHNRLAVVLCIINVLDEYMSLQKRDLVCYI